MCSLCRVNWGAIKMRHLRSESWTDEKLNLILILILCVYTI